MPTPRDLEELCRSARISIIEMTHRAKSAHVGSSLSVVELLVAAYAHVQSVSPSSKVLLSKGHAAAALYSVLAEFQYIPKDLLSTYCENGSLLSGHASHNVSPGVPLSTGSLGHALPVAVGMALNNKLTKSVDQTVVVLSDGECDEGSNWEAALFASHHKLSNLKVLIDRNGLQSISTTESTLSLEPLADKWTSFGWGVSVSNGHDVEELLSHLQGSPGGDLKPQVIIASTTKGKGVTFMEGSNVWHYRSPDATDVRAALGELETGGSQ